MYRFQFDIKPQPLHHKVTCKDKHINMWRKSLKSSQEFYITALCDINVLAFYLMYTSIRIQVCW